MYECIHSMDSSTRGEYRPCQVWNLANVQRETILPEALANTRSGFVLKTTGVNRYEWYSVGIKYKNMHELAQVPCKLGVESWIKTRNQTPKLASETPLGSLNPKEDRPPVNRVPPAEAMQRMVVQADSYWFYNYCARRWSWGAHGS